MDVLKMISNYGKTLTAHAINEVCDTLVLV